MQPKTARQNKDAPYTATLPPLVCVCTRCVLICYISLLTPYRDMNGGVWLYKVRLHFVHFSTYEVWVYGCTRCVLVLYISDGPHIAT